MDGGRIAITIVSVLALLALMGCAPTSSERSSADLDGNEVEPQLNPSKTPLPDDSDSSSSASTSPDPDAGSAGEEPPSEVQGDQSLDEAFSGREIRLTPTVPPGLERVPAAEPSRVTGEVPAELLAAVVADLRDRASISSEDVEIIRAEFVVWNDGSLGCPEPGAMYTQALTRGYWIELQVGESRFDYRANDGGYFFLCTVPSFGQPVSAPKQ